MRQTQMAELVEVSHSHYSKCESGHNSFSARFLEKFAERTGVSLSWLVSGKGDMHPGTPGRKEPVAPPVGAAPVSHVPGADRPLPGGLQMEELVKRVLETARDAKVVAAAEALVRATGNSYDESAALVISRRLLSHLQETPQTR
jgi:hypothetical protein